MTYPLLRDVRILDASSMIAGDTATGLLGDLGAEVIKVEGPPAGDPVREIEPLAGHPHLSSRHLVLNRNKRSVTLDVRVPEGRAVFLDLVRKVDVVFDSSAPGARDALGVGFAACAEARPEIVYCSLSAYGDRSRFAGAPAHAIGPEALSGLLRPVERPDRRLELRVPSARIPIAASALAAALGVLAALHHRDRTGQGVWLGTSQLQAAVWWQQIQAFEILNRLPIEQPVDGGGAGARYNFYACRDGGLIVIMPVERKFWERFCEVLERPDLKRRGSWEKGRLDFGIDDENLAIDLEATLRRRDRTDWLERFSRARVPVIAAMSLDELLADDTNIGVSDLLCGYDDPRLGRLRVVEPPLRVVGVEASPPTPAPDVGDDTTAILLELGYTPERIRDLHDSRATF